MSIAKILEDRKTDNMAEVEREGGVGGMVLFCFRMVAVVHSAAMRVIATARETYAFIPSS